MGSTTTAITALPARPGPPRLARDGQRTLPVPDADTRPACCRWKARHGGTLVQYDLGALAPDVLRNLNGGVFEGSTIPTPSTRAPSRGRRAQDRAQV